MQKLRHFGLEGQGLLAHRGEIASKIADGAHQAPAPETRAACNYGRGADLQDPLSCPELRGRAAGAIKSVRGVPDSATDPVANCPA